MRPCLGRVWSILPYALEQPLQVKTTNQEVNRWLLDDGIITTTTKWKLRLSSDDASFTHVDETETVTVFILLL